MFSWVVLLGAAAALLLGAGAVGVLLFFFVVRVQYNRVVLTESLGKRGRRLDEGLHILGLFERAIRLVWRFRDEGGLTYYTDSSIPLGAYRINPKPFTTMAADRTEATVDMWFCFTVVDPWTFAASDAGRSPVNVLLDTFVLAVRAAVAKTPSAALHKPGSLVFDFSAVEARFGIKFTDVQIENISGTAEMAVFDRENEMRSRKITASAALAEREHREKLHRMQFADAEARAEFERAEEVRVRQSAADIEHTRRAHAARMEQLRLLAEQDEKTNASALAAAKAASARAEEAAASRAREVKLLAEAGVVDAAVLAKARIDASVEIARALGNSQVTHVGNEVFGMVMKTVANQ